MIKPIVLSLLVLMVASTPLRTFAEISARDKLDRGAESRFLAESGVKAQAETEVGWYIAGDWNGNDGGKYYIRQIGNRIWWYGERAPTSPAWSNVAEGYIQGNIIELDWADVPKGGIWGYGHLTLEVVSTT